MGLFPHHRHPLFLGWLWTQMAYRQTDGVPGGEAQPKTFGTPMTASQYGYNTPPPDAGQYIPPGSGQQRQPMQVTTTMLKLMSRRVSAYPQRSTSQIVLRWQHLTPKTSVCRLVCSRSLRHAHNHQRKISLTLHVVLTKTFLFVPSFPFPFVAFSLPAPKYPIQYPTTTSPPAAYHPTGHTAGASQAGHGGSQAPGVSPLDTYLNPPGWKFQRRLWGAYNP